MAQLAMISNTFCRQASPSILCSLLVGFQPWGSIMPGGRECAFFQASHAPKKHLADAILGFIIPMEIALQQGEWDWHIQLLTSAEGRLIVKKSRPSFLIVPCHRHPIAMQSKRNDWFVHLQLSLYASEGHPMLTGRSRLCKPSGSAKRPAIHS